MKLTQNLYNSLHEVGQSIYHGCMFNSFNLQTNNPILNVFEFNITVLNVDHNMEWEVNNLHLNNLPPYHKKALEDITSLGLDIGDIIIQYYNPDVIVDYLIEDHDKVIVETMKEYLPNMVKEYNLEKIPFAEWPLWMQDFIADGFDNIDYNLGYKDRKRNAHYESVCWDEPEKQETEDVIVLNGIRYKKLD